MASLILLSTGLAIYYGHKQHEKRAALKAARLSSSSPTNTISVTPLTRDLSNEDVPPAYQQAGVALPEYEYTDSDSASEYSVGHASDLKGNGNVNVQQKKVKEGGLRSKLRGLKRN
jgi:hypothetical protein